MSLLAMELIQLLDILKNHPDRSMRIVLPTGTSIPAHFHVTEVGHIQKRFVDCGGTLRSSASCLLQIWVANDLDHRLDSTKLSKIIEKGLGLFDNQHIPVEIEYEQGVLSQYPLQSISNGRGVRSDARQRSRRST
ncbi:MAG: DUF6428 family protein [Pirellula sp.]